MKVLRIFYEDVGIGDCGMKGGEHTSMEDKGNNRCAG